ncbi:MAG: choice-of-anchor L domain-containing protein [Bacteroidales bacterium]|nr:choice-of-anchor L domain-containing protein [Bacteroidales bacterium]
MKRIILLVSILFGLNTAYSQLQIDQTLTPSQLVHQVLVGSGVTISNVTYTGDLIAIGKFDNGSTTNLGLHSGVVLTSGSATNTIGPNSSGSITLNNSGGSDPQLASLITQNINDAAVLEFDFVPIADTVKFTYVFGSDEYPEFSTSSFNDVFGFFITGLNPSGGSYLNYNMAFIPGTSIPVTINNINNGSSNNGPCTNCSYYINNTSGITLEYDGLTTVMTAWTLVTPCTTYHFKAAVGDASDAAYDSGVFIKAGSFSTNAVQVASDYTIPGAINKGIEGCNSAAVTVTIPEILTYSYVVNIDTMWGTATNGVDFPTITNTITVPAGQLSASLILSPLVDNVAEGQEEWNMVFETSPCTVDTITIPIIDYVPITFASTMNDTMVCADSLMMKCFPIDGWPSTYMFDWSPSGDFMNNQLQNAWANPSQTTTYFLSITDSSGCPAVIDSINVSVFPKINASFLPDIFKGCEPLEVSFEDMTTPAAANWKWYFGDGDTSIIQNPTHIYSAGIYDIKLEVSSASGCKSELEVSNFIKVYEKPIPNFYLDPSVVTIDESTISFINTTNNGSAFNYLWDFGDGSSDVTFNASHAYNDAGEFEVWLYAESDKGCKDSISFLATVIVDEIEVPNVITPNGDGFNDIFYIKNITKLQSSKLMIYNRWGTKVFSVENYKNDWDGDDLPDGVYYWYLEYKTYFRESVEKGTVTIIK